MEEEDKKPTTIPTPNTPNTTTTTTMEQTPSGSSGSGRRIVVRGASSPSRIPVPVRSRSLSSFPPSPSASALSSPPPPSSTRTTTTSSTPSPLSSSSSRPSSIARAYPVGMSKSAIQVSPLSARRKPDRVLSPRESGGVHGSNPKDVRSEPAEESQSFDCQRVVDAPRGDRGVRCMLRVGDSVWGGARDGMSIDVKSLKTGKQVKRIRHPDEDNPNRKQTDSLRLDVVSLAEVLPNVIWSGGLDGMVYVWQADNYQCLKKFIAHTGSVEQLLVDESHNVWSASTDFTIKLWDGRSHFPKLTLQGHSNWVRCIAICDDKLWSGSDDGTIRIWHRKTGDPLEEIVLHEGVLTLLQVDSHIWAGCRDKTIKIYDTEKYNCVATLKGHRGWVNCLTLVGEQVWSGSADRTLRVWDALKMKLIQKIEGFGGWMYSVASMGHVLWASCSDRKIRIYGIVVTKGSKIIPVVPPSKDPPPAEQANVRADAASQTEWRVVVVGFQPWVSNSQAGNDADDSADERNDDDDKGDDGDSDLDSLGGSDLEMADPLLHQQLEREIALKNDQIELLHRNLKDQLEALKQLQSDSETMRENMAHSLDEQAKMMVENDILRNNLELTEKKIAEFEAQISHSTHSEDNLDRTLGSQQDSEWLTGEESTDYSMDLNIADPDFEHNARTSTPQKEERSPLGKGPLVVETTFSQDKSCQTIAPTVSECGTETDVSASHGIDAETSTDAVTRRSVDSQTEEAIEAEKEEGEEEKRGEDAVPEAVLRVDGHSQTDMGHWSAQADRRDANVGTEPTPFASSERSPCCDAEMQTEGSSTADAAQQTDLNLPPLMTTAHVGIQAAVELQDVATEPDRKAATADAQSQTEKLEEEPDVDADVVDSASQESEQNGMKLLCRRCNQYIAMDDMDNHSRVCWQRGSISQQSDIQSDLATDQLEHDNRNLMSKISDLTEQLKEDISSEGKLNIYQELLTLKDQLIANVINQKVNALMRAGGYDVELTISKREVERLNAVILTSRLEDKFESEADIVHAMLGDDLAADKIKASRASGWLLKRSDVIKKWNKRFFILVDKFFLYYITKKKDEQPRGICVLNNVVVNPLPDSVMNRPFCFRMNTPKHEFLLCASSELERKSWISAITEAGKWWNSSEQFSTSMSLARRQSDLVLQSSSELPFPNAMDAHQESEAALKDAAATTSGKGRK